MQTYTERWAEAAEEARRKLHPDSSASLWGKDPNPPRGPKKLLDLTASWYAKESNHDLKQETGQSARMRTLDFFIGWKPELSDVLVKKISTVVFDGKRYGLAAEPRMQAGEPRFLRVICWPTGEAV